MSDKEVLVNRAKLAEQAERYEDMAKVPCLCGALESVGPCL